MVVFSLATVTKRDVPNQSELNFSNLIPFSGETTVPPVKVAISSNRCKRRSPKSGDLTAHTFKIPLILLTNNVDKASPSTSSAIINKGELA